MQRKNSESAIPVVDTDGASQTAQDYINTQLKLENEAREILPYAFDTCSKPMGPLRQLIFACMSCTPEGSEPAGFCYSCSISCHGSHGELVELFSKRNFECDCGTTRLSKCRCELRKAQDEIAGPTNSYNQNFRNLFCEGEPYEHESELGTMYQCLLGDACGEDWFHDRCILGLRDHPSEYKPRYDENATGGDQHPPSTESEPEKLDDFPDEEDFEHFICWKCVSGNSWLLDYIGTTGFLEPVVRKELNAALPSKTDEHAPSSRKRKASTASDADTTLIESREGQKSKTTDMLVDETTPSSKPLLESNLSTEGACKLLRRTHHDLHGKQVSIFLRADFRDSLCRCSHCLKILGKYPFLLEEEETYEPPLDDDATDTGSLFDAGEKALSSIDRVRAIEGVMAYNMLKQKVRDFLQPFAEENRVVSSEDVIKYFEDLKGSSNASKAADEKDHGQRTPKNNDSSDQRGQEGY